MSYCRFSSNDFKSDVYVYEALDGVVIHVAGNRLDPVRPMPPPIHELLVPGTKIWMDAWLDRKRQIQDIVEESAHIPIGLGCDGESYYGLNPRDAAIKLTALAELGYYVPEGVIEAVEEDACTECGESTADNEGYDGLCGTCADRSESEEED